MFPPLSLQGTVTAQQLMCGYLGPKRVEHDGTYDLRRAVARPEGKCEEYAKLFEGGEMDQHLFGRYPPNKTRNLRHWFWEEFVSTFAKRFDGSSNLAIAMRPPTWRDAPANLFLVPRVTLDWYRPRSAGMLVTSSGSRFLDWYSVLGWERFEEVAGRIRRGRYDVSRPTKMRDTAAIEAGLRVRLPAKQVPVLEWLLVLPGMKSALVGFRAGVATRVDHRRDSFTGRRGGLHDTRLVFELGGAAW
jgi:hypothetical protein